MRFILLYLSLLTGSLFSVYAQHNSAKFTENMKTEMREKVKEAAQHAWSGYQKYASGFDDLKPLTANGKNWYRSPLYMTPVDAFDTFTILGLTKEAGEAKETILSKLNFDNDYIQVFEVTIRILGGLITAYEMDGNKHFLELATELADKMMPAFYSRTGMPYRFVNLQNGQVKDSINNPAEIGTLMLEFGQLSKHTGNLKYYSAAKKAIMFVFSKRSRLNLVGEQINVETGEWVSTKSHISGYIDSYYEYLYKGWLLFGDIDLKKAFDLHNAAIKKNLISKTKHGWFLAHVDMNNQKLLETKYGALDAFYAGLCAYAGDISTAAKIQQANYYMWTNFNMEPEEFDFSNDSITSPYYILRPEIIESCFYLYRKTHKDEYLWMAKNIIDDILKNCRTESAFASIKDVRTLVKFNSMESFFFAETLKYAFLVFAPDTAIDLNKIVFNTEAHPFKIQKQK